MCLTFIISSAVTAAEPETASLLSFLQPLLCCEKCKSFSGQIELLSGGFCISLLRFLPPQAATACSTSIAKTGSPNCNFAAAVTAAAIPGLPVFFERFCLFQYSQPAIRPSDHGDFGLNHNLSPTFPSRLSDTSMIAHSLLPVNSICRRFSRFFSFLYFLSCHL